MKALSGRELQRGDRRAGAGICADRSWRPQAAATTTTIRGRDVRGRYPPPRQAIYFCPVFHRYLMFTQNLGRYLGEGAFPTPRQRRYPMRRRHDNCQLSTVNP